MTKYISKEDAIKVAEKYGITNGSALGTHSGVADCIAAEIYRLPDYAVVNRTAYDQATFERDTALQQLKSIGKGLGERMDDVAPVVHGRWIFTKRHLWYKDENGNIDEWRVDNGFHNGPECQICHTAFCEQCTPDWSTTECKIGHYYCSECAETSRDAQITMVFEEMAELQKELCKNSRGDENIPHIAEEIADCLIMLEQMQILFCCQDKVDDFIAAKLKRLEQRMDNETN